MTTSPRRYAVLCDGRKEPGTVLAHIPMTLYGKVVGYWTPGILDHVGCFTKKGAEQVRNGLSYNNPRVVRYEKAIHAIAVQHCSAVMASPTAHETLRGKAMANAYLATQALHKVPLEAI